MSAAQAMQVIDSDQTRAMRPAQSHTLNRDASEYLAFCLGSQTYVVDILKVQEIRGVERVTRLPNSDGYMRGVINLRGTIVSVIDLRARLGMESIEYTALSVMIVIMLGDRTFAMVVDSVSDVVQISEDAIRRTPPSGNSVDPRVIAGVGVVDQRMLLMLDVYRVFQVDVVADCGQNSA